MDDITAAGFMQDVKAGVAPFKDQTFVAVLPALVAEHVQLYEQTLNTYQSLGTGRDLYQAAAAKLTQLAGTIEAESAIFQQREVKRSAENRTAASFTVVVMLLIGLVVVVAAYLVNKRTVVEPIRRVSRRLQDIARGDGDLRVRLEVKGNDEITDLCRGFNGFTGKTREMVTRLADAVVHLNQETDRLQALTQSGVEQLKDQQRETTQVATAMQQMSASVLHVADSTTGATRNAEAAEAAANNGKTTLKHTLHALEQLAGQVEQGTETIVKLEQESDAIGGVLDVIRSIAEQTNLLALNAAIEAARAGEKGRGFAVVADEVRTLASRTQSSTAEIQAMIERLQTGARDAAMAMKESHAQAQKTVARSSLTEQTLDSITTAVATINGMNQQIACAVDQQSSNAEEVARSMTNIRNAGQQIVGNSDDMLSATRALSQLSSDLQDMVAQFKF